MTKQCLQCSKTFQIEDRDFEFYQKVNVPAPTLCPDCRMQRRLAWRNERFYYQRTCDKTGAPIISIYAPDSPIKRVYEHRAWFSDDWDGLEYGRDFDFSRSFFEQFAEMMYGVPHINLWLWEGENADYNHCCMGLKNSYMNAATDKSEDSYYCYISVNNRSVVDCTAVEHTELGIECVDSANLYQSAFCQQCRNCLEAYASFDCSDCKYIFGCSGLRHKEYYLFNKPVSPVEWRTQVKKLLGSYGALQTALHKQYNISLAVPRLYNAIYNSEQCTGNYIWNSRDCQMSYDCRECDSVKYVAYAPWQAKDSMDCYAIGDAELLYDANYGPSVYNAQFTFWQKNGPNNSQYCIFCVNGCDQLFGCVGLKGKKYCILNKQYSQSEYEALRAKIIEHMKQTGEYGELFPIKYSPFGYNETTAQEYFLLTQAEVQRNGWRWREQTGGTFGQETLIPDAMPDDVALTDISITQQVLKCGQCTRNFKMVQGEYEIYRRMGVALPRLCPNCRHLQRIQLRNPRQLWHRQCMCTQTDHQHKGRCAQEFETTYSPERKEIIYCDSCYRKELD